MGFAWCARAPEAVATGGKPAEHDVGAGYPETHRPFAPKISTFEAWQPGEAKSAIGLVTSPQAVHGTGVTGALAVGGQVTYRKRGGIAVRNGRAPPCDSSNYSTLAKHPPGHWTWQLMPVACGRSLELGARGAGEQSWRAGVTDMALYGISEKR